MARRTEPAPPPPKKDSSAPVSARAGCGGPRVGVPEEPAHRPEWGAGLPNRVVLQSPWTGASGRSDKVLSRVCGVEKGSTHCPAPSEVVFGRGAHEKLTTRSLELFRDFLEGRPTPPTGAE